MSEQSIDQLRAEAAERRQAIATDLELMGDRVSPARMAERRKAAFRERMTGVRNSVFGTPDQPSRSHAAYGYPQTYGEPSHAATTLREGGNGSASLSDRAGGAVEAVRQHTPDSLGEATQGNPLGVAVVGFGVGLLAATLLPSSPDEKRLANRIQGSLEEGAAQLGGMGKDAIDHIKPEAQQAVADVKDSAKEHVETVKSEAQDKASSVRDTAQSKSEEVRSQA
jgi:gas vesicle protein